MDWLYTSLVSADDSVLVLFLPCHDEQLFPERRL
jgi:hypothetical protein